MKHLLSNTVWVIALSLAVTACSKQEPATPAAEEPAMADEPAVTETAPPTSTTDETEALVVVEESAAVVESEDKAIMLARADDTDTPLRTWKFKEGQHYTRMVPTQPTVGGSDKVEVAEIFMYSCPHCRDLEAYINRWEENKSPDVRFVRIPAVFNKLAQLHAQLYFTEEVLANNGLLADHIGFRNMVFDEYHSRGNRLTSEEAIQRLFARAGVKEEDFQRTWTSFEVNQKMRVAADLARRYSVNSVPMVVVNGKYRTDATTTGSYATMLEVVDELTAREGVR